MGEEVKPLELTGRRFGRLVALHVSKPQGKSRLRRAWLCLCDCGSAKEVVVGNLVGGHTKTCGCSLFKSGKSSPSYTHGLTKSLTYNTWQKMRSRCENPKDKSYKNYGARGIRVCKRWSSFESFFVDMGTKPKGKWIERINNNGNYSPENCKWASIKEQSLNRRTNHILLFRGKSKPLTTWAEELNIPWSALLGRIRLGWSVKDALTKPLRSDRRRRA